MLNGQVFWQACDNTLTKELHGFNSVAGSLDDSSLNVKLTFPEMSEVVEWSNDDRLNHAKKLFLETTKGQQKLSQASGKRKRESGVSNSSKTEELVSLKMCHLRPLIH